jgi:hypothetical protein
MGSSVMCATPEEPAEEPAPLLVMLRSFAQLVLTSSFIQRSVVESSGVNVLAGRSDRA